MRSAARLSLVLVVAVCGLFSAAGPAAAAAPTHGMYENCSPSDGEECLTRLAEMRGAGITRVINYWAWQGSDAEVRAYADEAERLGIKLLWPIYDQWTSDELRDRLEFARVHPATWGYYMGEELDPGHAAALTARAAEVRRLDTTHRRMYVAWGGSDLAQTLAPFRGAADVLGSDYYPTGLDQPVSATKRIASTTRTIAGGSAHAAMVLQAFDWDQEPALAPPFSTGGFPSLRTMRRQLGHAVAGGVRRIYWFDYYFLRPPGSSDYSRLRTLSRAISLGPLR